MRSYLRFICAYSFVFIYFLEFTGLSIFHCLTKTKYLFISASIYLLWKVWRNGCRRKAVAQSLKMLPLHRPWLLFVFNSGEGLTNLSKTKLIKFEVSLLIECLYLLYFIRLSLMTIAGILIILVQRKFKKSKRFLVPMKMLNHICFYSCF